MAGRVPLLVQISVEGHPWAPREQFFWFTFMPVIIPKAAMGTRQLDPERYKVCGPMLRVTLFHPWVATLWGPKESDMT